MTNRRNRHPARRRFLKQAAAMTMSRIGTATALAVPALALARTDPQTPAPEQSPPADRSRPVSETAPAPGSEPTARRARPSNPARRHGDSGTK